jgi:membrane-associated protease RseP (regulator of RpoE activity)
MTTFKEINPAQCPTSERSPHRSLLTTRFVIITVLVITMLPIPLVVPATLAQTYSPTPPPESDTVAMVEQLQIAKITRGLTNNDGGGIRVVAVPGGSPAQALHLRVGDIITSINGHAVTSTDDFVRTYREQGLPTHMTVQRDGQEIHVH